MTLQLHCESGSRQAIQCLLELAFGRHSALPLANKNTTEDFTTCCKHTKSASMISLLVAPAWLLWSWNSHDAFWKQIKRPWSTMHWLLHAMKSHLRSGQWLLAECEPMFQGAVGIWHAHTRRTTTVVVLKVFAQAWRAYRSWQQISNKQIDHERIPSLFCVSSYQLVSYPFRSPFFQSCFLFFLLLSGNPAFKANGEILNTSISCCFFLHLQTAEHLVSLPIPTILTDTVL